MSFFGLRKKQRHANGSNDGDVAHRSASFWGRLLGVGSFSSSSFAPREEVHGDGTVTSLNERGVETPGRPVLQSVSDGVQGASEQRGRGVEKPLLDSISDGHHGSSQMEDGYSEANSHVEVEKSQLEEEEEEDDDDDAEFFDASEVIIEQPREMELESVVIAIGSEKIPRKDEVNAEETGSVQSRNDENVGVGYSQSSDVSTASAQDNALRSRFVPRLKGESVAETEEEEAKRERRRERRGTSQTPRDSPQVTKKEQKPRVRKLNLLEESEEEEEEEQLAGSNDDEALESQPVISPLQTNWKLNISNDRWDSDINNHRADYLGTKSTPPRENLSFDETVELVYTAKNTQAFDRHRTPSPTSSQATNTNNDDDEHAADYIPKRRRIGLRKSKRLTGKKLPPRVKSGSPSSPESPPEYHTENSRIQNDKREQLLRSLEIDGFTRHFQSLEERFSQVPANVPRRLRSRRLDQLDSNSQKSSREHTVDHAKPDSDAQEGNRLRTVDHIDLTETQDEEETPAGEHVSSLDGAFEAAAAKPELDYGDHVYGKDNDDAVEVEIETSSEDDDDAIFAPAPRKKPKKITAARVDGRVHSKTSSRNGVKFGITESQDSDTHHFDAPPKRLSSLQNAATLKRNREKPAPVVFGVLHDSPEKAPSGSSVALLSKVIAGGQSPVSQLSCVPVPTAVLDATVSPKDGTSNSNSHSQKAALSVDSDEMSKSQKNHNDTTRATFDNRSQEFSKSPILLKSRQRKIREKLTQRARKVQAKHKVSKDRIRRRGNTITVVNTTSESESESENENDNVEDYRPFQDSGRSWSQSDEREEPHHRSSPVTNEKDDVPAVDETSNLQQTINDFEQYDSLFARDSSQRDPVADAVDASRESRGTSGREKTATPAETIRNGHVGPEAVAVATAELLEKGITPKSQKSISVPNQAAAGVQAAPKRQTPIRIRKEDADLVGGDVGKKNKSSQAANANDSSPLLTCKSPDDAAIATSTQEPVNKDENISGESGRVFSGLSPSTSVVMHLRNDGGPSRDVFSSQHYTLTSPSPNQNQNLNPHTAHDLSVAETKVTPIRIPSYLETIKGLNPREGDLKNLFEEESNIPSAREIAAEINRDLTLPTTAQKDGASDPLNHIQVEKTISQIHLSNESEKLRKDYTALSVVSPTEVNIGPKPFGTASKSKANDAEDEKDESFDMSQVAELIEDISSGKLKPRKRKREEPAEQPEELEDPLVPEETNMNTKKKKKKNNTRANKSRRRKSRRRGQQAASD
ncbi:uncharacterized protein LODBEIA_P48940 [Lodderomyces beijingensis]|uniref:DNA replication checkpoint mediator MRC1 domain-containing protein n=1 Tax=Lodderomyces beijingensis TaxID=1775926 RepID=A0ABP0ZTY9_9ASCO